MSTSKTTSLEKDCQGVSGIASPKHPQSVTLLKVSRIKGEEGKENDH